MICKICNKEISQGEPSFNMGTKAKIIAMVHMDCAGVEGYYDTEGRISDLVGER